MKTIKENIPVVGMLHTQFGDYELLDLLPNKHDVPWYFKDHNIWSFYVRDGYGVAKNILVGGSFLIVPATEPKVMDVTFFVDETEALVSDKSSLT